MIRKFYEGLDCFGTGGYTTEMRGAGDLPVFRKNGDVPLSDFSGDPNRNMKKFAMGDTGAISRLKQDIKFVESDSSKQTPVYVEYDNEGMFTTDINVVRALQKLREEKDKIRKEEDSCCVLLEKHKDEDFNKVKSGIKESNGKLFYELDWEFIEEMAKRMQKNKKDKYPKFNWHKPIEIEGLKQALTRHFIEIMKGNYKDEDQELGHLTALSLNAMMIWYQLKHHQDVLG